ncbi:MAG: diacylglycerol kinase family protein, partial [Bacteroidota bacterium]
MKTDQKWAIILNPAAGKGRGLKAWPALRSGLEASEIDYRIFESPGPGKIAEQVTTALKAHFRDLIVIGGDGTNFEVINSLIAYPDMESTTCRLAFYPAGTGNDWARSLGIPRKSNSWIELLNSENFRFHDLGWVTFYQGNKQGKQYFLNVAGIGFDAYVVEKYLQKMPFGKLSYLSGLLQGLVSYTYPTLHVKAGPTEYLTPAYLMAVGIGRFFGGGMKICPHAGHGSGEFGVTLIRDLPKWQIVQQLP